MIENNVHSKIGNLLGPFHSSASKICFHQSLACILSVNTQIYLSRSVQKRAVTAEFHS